MPLIGDRYIDSPTGEYTNQLVFGVNANNALSAWQCGEHVVATDVHPVRGGWQGYSSLYISFGVNLHEFAFAGHFTQTKIEQKATGTGSIVVARDFRGLGLHRIIGTIGEVCLRGDNLVDLVRSLVAVTSRLVFAQVPVQCFFMLRRRMLDGFLLPLDGLLEVARSAIRIACCKSL